MSAAPIPEPRWIRRFMQLCDTLAGFSEDPDRQVGAVIVGPGNRICASGWNGLPRGVTADADRFARASGEKFHWVEHAERNAIYNAASLGVALGGTMLCTNVFPCADCARAIIQSGITRLLTPPPPAWDSRLGRSFEVSAVMLREAGVAITTASSARPQVSI